MSLTSVVGVASRLVIAVEATPTTTSSVIISVDGVDLCGRSLSVMHEEGML